MGGGTTGRTRYEEAVEQMMRFLQAAGEETRFNVILFNDTATRARTKLVEASARNLEAARRSLLEREPGGGTNLRPAVELALQLDARGEVDLSRLEADTVIVLCDGATAEGRSWVRPTIDRVRAEARVVFHCVLLANRGDGTLELLSSETRGEFLHVGR